MSLLRFCDEKPLWFLLKCSIKRPELPGLWRCPHVTGPAGDISLAWPRTAPSFDSFIHHASGISFFFVDSHVSAGSLEPKFLNTVLARVPDEVLHLGRLTMASLGLQGRV